MTADATLMHYFVLLFMFKMIPVPAGHNQGGILGVPPPPLPLPQKILICNHFHNAYCGAGSEFCKDNMSWYIKKTQLQLAHSASREHFQQPNCNYMPFAACSYSIHTLHSDIFILVHHLYNKTEIVLVLKWSGDVERKPIYAVSFTFNVCTSLSHGLTQLYHCSDLESVTCTDIF
jgi:hypothetical protein